MRDVARSHLVTVVSNRIKTAALPATVVKDATARAAGCHPETVRRVLTGEIMCPGLPILQAMAKVLGIPVRELTTAAENDGCPIYREHERRVGRPIGS